MTDDTPVETLKRRCPRLGSPIEFGYCLSAGDDKQACWKIFDCWWEIFDVAAYLRNSLPAQEFEQLQAKAAAPPKNKLTGILEIAEQARKRKKEENKS